MVKITICIHFFLNSSKKILKEISKKLLKRPELRLWRWNNNHSCVVGTWSSWDRTRAAVKRSVNASTPMSQLSRGAARVMRAARGRGGGDEWISEPIRGLDEQKILTSH